MEEDIIQIGNTYLSYEEIYKKLVNELNTMINEELYNDFNSSYARFKFFEEKLQNEKDEL